MPDPHYCDHVTDHLRADVRRLEDLVRNLRDEIMQLNRSIAQLADKNYEMSRRLEGLPESTSPWGTS